jgi:hypothetical protein
LEISGIVAIDLDNHTAVHLEAAQILPKKSENLMEWYANTLTDRASQTAQNIGYRDSRRLFFQRILRFKTF